MTIDPASETLIPLRSAPKHVPGRPHISTLWRWTRREPNPLAVVRVGGRVFTSIEAISRFISEGNPGNPSPTRTIDLRRREIERARRDLEAAGFSTEAGR